MHFYFAVGFNFRHGYNICEFDMLVMCGLLVVLALNNLNNCSLSLSLSLLISFFNFAVCCHQ